MIRPALGSLFTLLGMLAFADVGAQVSAGPAHQVFAEGLPGATALRADATTGAAVPARAAVARNVWSLFRKSYPSDLRVAELSNADIDRYFTHLITLGLATLNSGVGRETEAEVAALHVFLVGEMDRRGMLTSRRLLEVQSNFILGREVGLILELRGKYPALMGTPAQLPAISLPATSEFQNAVWRRSVGKGSFEPVAYMLASDRVALVMQDGCRFATEALADLSRRESSSLSRMDVLLTPGSSFEFPVLQEIADAHPGMKIFLIYRNDRFNIGVDTRISPQFVHGATRARMFGWPGNRAFARWVDGQEP